MRQILPTPVNRVLLTRPIIDATFMGISHLTRHGDDRFPLIA